MSEEQIKPKLKWNKNWPAILFFLALVGFTAFVIFLLTGSKDGSTVPHPYTTAIEQIQNAVTAYQANNNNSLPILSGTYTNANCSNCHVVNISALLTANGGMMRMAPDGLNLSASGNDNCGGNASLGCKKGSSYIWIVDSNGSVYSYCAGSKCSTNNSGFQYSNGYAWP